MQKLDRTDFPLLFINTSHFLTQQINVPAHNCFFFLIIIELHRNLLTAIVSYKSVIFKNVYPMILRIYVVCELAYFRFKAKA